MTVKVSAIVRLNNKVKMVLHVIPCVDAHAQEYDRNEFVKNGFNHYDLFFEVSCSMRIVLSEFLCRTAQHRQS